ncbi:Hsp70 family protein [Paenibacillus assamensis]|uniref:Hsp70 family protein n=1 Tax=Paenibacillus assamensis TaxID=311244 RepID=UPI0004010497
MIIGIDLGMTFSAVAYVDKDGIPVIIPNHEGERTSPSVILFEQSVPNTYPYFHKSPPIVSYEEGIDKALCKMIELPLKTDTH